MSAPSFQGSSSRVLRFTGFRRAASDIERSIDFYVEALGFAIDRSHGADEPRSDGGPPGRPSAHHVRLTLGRESIQLFAPVGYERCPGTDAPGAAVSDLAFHHIAIVTNDMDAALHRLQAYSPAAISTGGQVRLPQSAGGVVAYKFRDPDGHPLELIRFPSGVGDPRWQAGSTRSTLGIDHSAIVVSNVEQSLAFYVGALGFVQQSRQTNSGPEQARLDGTEPVEVEVIGLAPRQAATPHLELLAYRVPISRRARPLQALGDDHADRMTFAVDDLSPFVGRSESVPDASAMERRMLCSNELLVRDDDGHAILLQQSSSGAHGEWK